MQSPQKILIFLEPPIIIENITKEKFMEWTIIGLNILYAVIGVVLMFVSYKLFDLLSPKINFEDELKKGNLAVAIFIAAIFIAIALIIGGSLN
jgi:uncharacterized membrane protein YjfL (UPF0719 family)